MCGELLIFDTNQQFATHRSTGYLSNRLALCPVPISPHQYREAHDHPAFFRTLLEAARNEPRLHDLAPARQFTEEAERIGYGLKQFVTKSDGP